MDRRGRDGCARCKNDSGLRRLRWSPAAASDLEGISDYLYLHHPNFAASTVQRLYAAAKSLREFPFTGRIGKKDGTRELVLAPLPYIMIYSADDQTVDILRFLHSYQERP